MLLDAELAVDLNPATFGSAPSGFVTLGASTYYFAQGALWKTDGTPSGTAAVRAGVGAAQNVTPAGDRIYFAAVTPGSGGDPVYPNELWASDGTADGTVMLHRFDPLGVTSPPSGFVQYHGRVYFRAYTRADGFQIWSTDGPPAGTARFTDPAAESLTIGWPVVSGDYLYYHYFEGTGTGDSSLWRTDGTAAGTI